MTYVSGGLGAALALMHSHTHGRLSWLSCTPTHGRLTWLPTPHTHTPVAFGQAGEGLTWLDGGGKGYGYNSIKTELLLYI